MVDPNAAIASTVSAGAVTITGTIVGLPVAGLIGGFAGGLIALLHLPPLGTKNSLLSAAAACFLGGVGAPLIVAYGLSEFSWMKGLDNSYLLCAAGSFIGLTAQVSIPLIFGWIRKEGEKKNG